MAKTVGEKPSMEKSFTKPSTDRPSVDRTSVWQVTSTAPGRTNSGTTCVEATFCPCIVYGRTSTRLQYALSGRDATSLSEISSCNFVCWQFCVCFPFYGCFISKIQETVRAYYDIRGTHRGDLVDGCCCPCCALFINDEEIYRREMMENKLRTIRESFLPSAAPSELRSRRPSAEYRSHKPMAVHICQDVQEPIIISPPRSKSATFGIKDEDDDAAGLESIPELSNGGSATPPRIPEPVLHPQSSTVKSPSPTRSPDSEAKGSTNLAEMGRRAIVQQLSRFFPDHDVKKENYRPRSDENTPANDPDAIHALNDDARYASKAVSQHAAHGLHDHSKAPTAQSRFKEHGLEEDKSVPPSQILSPSHLLASDPVVSKVHSSGPHGLESDKEASPHPVTNPVHDLTADSTAAFHTPPAHQLDRDPLETSRPKGLWPNLARHDIHADEVVRQASSLSHGLHDDVVGLSTTPAPHGLEGDEIHESAVSATHALESDAQKEA